MTAYLIGSFPTGVIASKLKRSAPDIRYHGSGNVGGTNAMRLMGARIGAVVVIIDALKGLLAWAIAYIIMLGNMWALPIAGTMAVIGHCWPIYTKFHGGLGIATGGGLIFVLSPWTIVLIVPIWALVFIGLYKRKYSPRAVILALPTAAVISIFFFPLALNVQWLLALVTTTLIIRHLPQWHRIE